MLDFMHLMTKLRPYVHTFLQELSSIWLQLRSLSELKSDESKSDGALSSILKVPKNTHCIFFNVLTYNLDGRDVQQVSTKNCS
uniref:Uncharacterized protein n=1 Tax=Rhizophora mucronata TaxID=61149 RepID=A0A2P2IIM4_RHIMU